MIPEVHDTNNMPTKKLDLSFLSEVLSVNIESSSAIVESSCTMEKLVNATLSYGLIPKVLPEMKGMSVGGAISGAALEGSSFKYGQFSDTCRNIWVLLANGTVMKCRC